MAKTPVKSYFSKKLTFLLDEVGKAIGEDRSNTLKIAFLTYAKEIGAVQAFLINNPEVFTE